MRTWRNILDVKGQAWSLMDRATTDEQKRRIIKVADRYLSNMAEYTKGMAFPIIRRVPRSVYAR